MPARRWTVTEWRRVKLPAPKVGYAAERRRLDWGGATGRAARRGAWHVWHDWGAWLMIPRTRRFCHAKLWPKPAVTDGPTWRGEVARAIEDGSAARAMRWGLDDARA